jgi:hypothetical protein
MARAVCGGLDFQVAVFGFFGGFFVSFFGIFEVFVLPLGVAQGGFVDSGGVDYDFGFDYGLEIGTAQVERRGLQGVEEEAGGFVVDLVGDQQAHDLHEGDLDRVGVLEDGQVEGGRGLAGLRGIDDDALIVPLFMKETEAAIANRGRSTLRPIDLDVLAARDVGAIHGYPPLPSRSLESSG